jgi:trans-aconitate methyltransferase
MSPTGTSGQTWNADGYNRHAGFVSDMGLPVIDLLAPRAGERILDLGCGEGRLARHLMDFGCHVVGFDASPDFVTAAVARGVDARQGDAHALPFTAEFDAVFSNAALHWMTDPDAVIAGVVRALVRGGRFVGEMGGTGNVAGICAALVRALDRRGLDGAATVPWYFPTPDEYRAKLEAAGLTVRAMTLTVRPTPLPTDMTGWLATFAQTFTRLLPEEEQPAFLDEVAADLAPSMRGADGQWTADYVRLRFAATLPAAGGLAGGSDAL